MKEIGGFVCTALLCVVAITINLSGTSCDVDPTLLCSMEFCSVSIINNVRIDIYFLKHGLFFKLFLHDSYKNYPEVDGLL